MANTIYNAEKPVSEDFRGTCDKIYCINKALSMCEAYYEIQLPEIFFVEHPLSTILGRAQYGNCFAVYQGCTVGANELGRYPVLGNHVIMFSNSKVLGDSHLGNDIILSANAYVKDMDIPNGSIVYGQSPNLVIKQNHKDIIDEWNKKLFKI